MKRVELLGVVGVVIGVVIVVPVVLNGVVIATSKTANGVAKLRFNRRMRKGIKKGEIVEINGEFYEVTLED